MKIGCLISIFVLCFQSRAQDSITVIEQIHIQKSSINPLKSQQMNRSMIQFLNLDDVGALFQKMSGVNLKSYGGLGGMKTIAVKGLNSQHTSLAIDGFSVNNTQTGQVNLATIQLDNIESMQLISSGGFDLNVPISTLCSGSSVLIQTFENHFGNKKINIRSALKVGSFGEKDAYLSLKKTDSNFYLCISSKYRNAKGNYPYQFENGYQTVNGIRTNNDYQDGFIIGTFGLKIKKQGVLRFIVKQNAIHQGLPGAVILYNNTAKQRLSTSNSTIQSDYSGKLKAIDFRVYTNYAYDAIHYFDPSYLNSSNELKNNYFNNLWQNGISFSRAIKQIQFFGGYEIRLAQLNASTVLAHPYRKHQFSLLGFKWSVKRLFFEGNIGYQQVNERNSTEIAREKTNRITTTNHLEIELAKKWNGLVICMYKNTFRMPSFNELYYNNIGNNQLKPEKVQQLELGFSCLPVQAIRLTINSYYSQVQNQIQAIPTKNLFIWSIQNIGKVQTLGIEQRLDWTTKKWRKFYATIGLNYTYQKTIDVTNSSSPSFQNQLAYYPKHMGNADVKLSDNRLSFLFASSFYSKRYVLNENISANEISGFYLLDFSSSYLMKVNKTHELKLIISIKNCTNNSYAFIRSFVMPGRNFNLTLHYAL